METRSSSSSVIKNPGPFSTSASASFHSRLSASSSGSQRRLRALSRADSNFDSELSKHNDEAPKSPAILRSLPSSAASSPSLPFHNSEKVVLTQRRPLIYWTIVAYCLLSVALFTTRTFGLLQGFYCHTSQSPLVSPVDNLSHFHRLSKILPMKPQPVSFFPFASYGWATVHDSEVTACLWVELDDLRYLEDWSVSWQGPLSVVVVTNSSRQKAQVQIKALSKLPKVTFHIIERLPRGSRTANSYLNLARLFSRTRYVVLFPASPQIRATETLYDKISIKISSFNTSRLASPHVLSPSKFTANSPIPFPPLVPLLIEQGYPIWCSERFFTAPSREADWEECLWQFWLNSYGTLPTLTEPNSGSPLNGTKNGSVGPLAAEEIIHRRLSNKSRQESCMLAAKGLKERSETPDKVDPHKAQWLRKTCRQVVNNWGKELS